MEKSYWFKSVHLLDSCCKMHVFSGKMQCDSMPEREILCGICSLSSLIRDFGLYLDCHRKWFTSLEGISWIIIARIILQNHFGEKKKLEQKKTIFFGHLSKNIPKKTKMKTEIDYMSVKAKKCNHFWNFCRNGNLKSSSQFDNSTKVVRYSCREFIQVNSKKFVVKLQNLKSEKWKHMLECTYQSAHV